jgi:large subunit ribosomal protein L13
MGDHVVVDNAAPGGFTGSKQRPKFIAGTLSIRAGLRENSGDLKCCDKHPERVIELAVKGMLPKSKLGRAMAKKLKSLC